MIKSGRNVTPRGDRPLDVLISYGNVFLFLLFQWDLLFPVGTSKGAVPEEIANVFIHRDGK